MIVSYLNFKALNVEPIKGKTFFFPLAFNIQKSQVAD